MPKFGRPMLHIILYYPPSFTLDPFVWSRRPRVKKVNKQAWCQPWTKWPSSTLGSGTKGKIWIFVGKSFLSNFPTLSKNRPRWRPVPRRPLLRSLRKCRHRILREKSVPIRQISAFYLPFEILLKMRVFQKKNKVKTESRRMKISVLSFHIPNSPNFKRQ